MNTTASLSVLDELEDAWQTTDRLFGLLADEKALLEAPLPLRHPFVFYLGHMPAFAWNHVARGALGREPFRPEFDSLFARGIDPPDEEAAREVAITEWPATEEILAYRDRVRDELRACAAEVASRSEDPMCADLRVFHLVLEHELMHHETLLYILHELDPPRLVPQPDSDPWAGDDPGPAPVLEIPDGTATIGADPDQLVFGWDNELPRTRERVRAFRIEAWPVTVAAFREFVEAGGYARAELWRPEHRAWAADRSAPHAWRRDERGWTHRTLFGRVPLDDVGGWPALVTCAEAEAFARWRGARLATEAELRWAAYGTPEGCERPYPWGSEVPGPSRGNFDLERFGLAPVDAHPAGRSAFGLDDLLGNAWEWTATDFAPRPGFEPLPSYPGYSADFFDGRHAVLFGGAWPTPRRLLRRSFRNWFRRTYPWVFATFRLAR